MPKGVPKNPKKCVICGKMFMPERSSTKICNDDHYVPCPVCGKQMLWNSRQQPSPCSKECKAELRKMRCREKYGVDHPMQNKEVQAHHRKSMKDKYGVEFALQSDQFYEKAKASNQKKFGVDWALSDPEIKKKSMKTMTERYGAPTTLQSKQLYDKYKATMEAKYGKSNPSKIDQFTEKAKQTMMERYGKENPMQVESINKIAMEHRIANYGSFWPDEIDEKAKQTWIEHLGVDNPSKSETIQMKIQETCMKKYGVPYGCLTNDAQCRKNRISKTNLKFLDAVKAVNENGELEFYLSGKFYDLHILDTNILIEIDPTYTHNIVGNHWNVTVDKGYHLEKTNIAKENGFRCIHIFDWDNWDKVIQLLTKKEVIYARNCKIVEIDKKECDEFLCKYHIQNTCKGQNIRVGLMYKGELVEVMTFGNSRYNRNYQYELLRLCSNSRYKITGGASKLFKYAVSHYHLNNIISYCDLSKFDGSVYSKLGMHFVKNTPPQEIWSLEKNKITANLLRQRGYDQLFNTDYGKGTPNEELMIDHGWLPVYDCGQAVYSYVK